MLVNVQAKRDVHIDTCSMPKDKLAANLSGGSQNISEYKPFDHLVEVIVVTCGNHAFIEGKDLQGI